VLLDAGADVSLAVDGDVTPVFMAHYLRGTDGKPDPRGKEIEAMLDAHGAFLNPITVAKYYLLGMIMAGAFMIDPGHSTF
jgi:hypothetical protein